MDLDLDHTTALVTASTGGIGAAVATALAEEGVRVIVHGRNAERAAAFARTLPVSAADDWVVGDLATADGLDEVRERAAHGDLDIVVHAAGPYGEHDWGSVEPQHWLDALRDNLTHVSTLSRAAIPGMTSRGWGRIVTLGARNVQRPLPHMVDYSAAKAALASATTSLALHLAGTGITAPGVLGKYRSEERAENFLG